MAWSYVQDNSGMTPEMYDQVAAELAGDPPAGLIVHVAGTHGDGMRIVDVWESEDAYMKFRDSRLRSAVEKVIGADGMAQGPPPIDALEVRNIVRGS
jgi:hypothetical protein